MVSQFRLLKLPSLAQRQVLLHFRAIDIFELSFTSTRVRDCVIRSARLRAIEHNVRFEEKYPHIVTVYKRDDGIDEDLLTWKFTGKDKKCFADPLEKIIGCHKFNECYKCRTTIFCRFHNSEFGVSVVFNYISTLFPGPVNLNLKLNNIRNIHALLLNENLSKCQNLDIWEAGDRKNKTDEDLGEILDLVSIGKGLKALVKQKDELDIEKIRNLESVLIMDAEWMDLSTLLSFKCRFGSFLKHKFGPNEITAFVENWYNSTDKKLEMMRFGWNACTPFELKRNDLKWEKWDPKRRSRYFYDSAERHPSNKIDCAEGYDVTRPDGVTATVLFEDAFDCSVLFLVWQGRYPEKTQLKSLSERMTRIDDKMKKLKSITPPRSDLKHHTHLDEEPNGLYNKLHEERLRLMSEMDNWEEKEIYDPSY